MVKKINPSIIKMIPKEVDSKTTKVNNPIVLNRTPKIKKINLIINIWLIKPTNIKNHICRFLSFI